MEYDKIEPVSDSGRLEQALALVGLRIAQALGAKAPKIEHFLLEREQEEAPQVSKDKQMEDEAVFLNALFGGIDLRKSAHPGAPGV